MRKRFPDESKVPNKYQSGDIVFFDSGSKPNPKMSARHKGPLEVVRQYKNDIQVRDLSTGIITDYLVGDLTPFFGSTKTAKELSLRHREQRKAMAILQP